MSGIVNLLKRFFICLLYSKRLVCQIYSGINSYMNFFKDHLNLSNNIYDNAKILKAAEINKQQEIVDRNPTTKYYQTLALNLQEQVQYLKRMLNEATPDGGLQMTDPERIQRFQLHRMQNDPEQGSPNTFPDPNRTKPYTGPGFFPTFTCPVGIPCGAPGSPRWIEEFKRWVRDQDGRWHSDNEFPYESDQWWDFEIGEQLKPPMRPHSPKPSRWPFWLPNN